MADGKPRTERDAALEIMGAIKKSAMTSDAFNLETGEPPYALYNPNLHPEREGELIWICANDPFGTLVSIFRHTCGSELNKDVSEVTPEEAKDVRDKLLADGWKKAKPPEVTFTIPEEEQTKQRRNPLKKRK